MKIGADLQKVLTKTYPPDKMIRQRFGRYDLAFKTDEEGRPVLLFMGKADEAGRIKGDHFVRHLQKDKDGTLVKNHWDNKGKV